MLDRYGYREQSYHQVKKITESYMYHNRLGTPRKIREVLKFYMSFIKSYQMKLL